MDDLGLPECTDPTSFARAFEAMTRQRADRVAPRERRRAPAVDDFGLPAEGSMADFAAALRAVRTAIPVAPRRRQ